MNLDHYDGGMVMKSEYPYNPAPGKSGRTESAAAIPVYRRENLGRDRRGNQIRQRSRAGGTQKSFLELTRLALGRPSAEFVATTGAFLSLQILSPQNSV